MERGRVGGEAHKSDRMKERERKEEGAKKEERDSDF